MSIIGIAALQSMMNTNNMIRRNSINLDLSRRQNSCWKEFNQFEYSCGQGGASSSKYINPYSCSTTAIISMSCQVSSNYGPINNPYYEHAYKNKDLYKSQVNILPLD
jgi:hypothetical protein